MIVRKFSMCSAHVKSTLFKTFCTPMYTAHLWRYYKKSSMQKLNVAYNDAMRLLLKVPRCSSASEMFVSIGVPTCSAVLRNLMHRCMCRLSDSDNSIVLTLTNPLLSSVRFVSKLWNHWRDSLYSMNLWFYVDTVCLCLSVYLYVFICHYGPCVFNKVWFDFNWIKRSIVFQLKAFKMYCLLSSHNIIENAQ